MMLRVHRKWRWKQEPASWPPAFELVGYDVLEYSPDNGERWLPVQVVEDEKPEHPDTLRLWPSDKAAGS